jgi:DNA polymerase-1
MRAGLCTEWLEGVDVLELVGRPALNKKIAAAIRDPECDLCKLCRGADEVCVTMSGPRQAEVMVVGRMPDSSAILSLKKDLEDLGMDPTTMAFTSAVKCINFDANVGKNDIKACRPYLEAEIAKVKPKWILTLGNEPLQSLTNHSGIMKYRGKVMEHSSGAKIFPTISPNAVLRNPGQRPSYLADLKLFQADMLGKEDTIPMPKIKKVASKERLKWLAEQLDRSELLSYDVETFSTPAGNEWAPDAQIISLSGTMLVDDELVVWALPLSHPESPFRKSWRSVLRFLAPHLERVPKQVAQNGKYDCRWLRHFGVRMKVTFDTMLAVHLLDENLPKSLKTQALMRLGVRPWAIDTKDLRTTPINQVLRYNALDTYYTYFVYLDAKAELKDHPRLARLLAFMMMPANEILIDVERLGVWIDREKLQTNSKIAYDMRAEIDQKLMSWVPKDDLGWPVNAKGKAVAVNFNPSNFLRWFLFEHLKFPIIRRGKDKDDGSLGWPSVAEDVMLELRMNHPHPVVDLLMERSKWQKYCSAFLSSYEELLDENDRIHTTFKLYGTVTGRLSSGKNEADKITARAPIRGVNLQQVPRDPFIRGLFGASPGYTFVEADFSQIELRVVAFISGDRTMRHLYQTNQDIHVATASWVLGIPQSQVSKEDRKKAKAVNFGFVYGMYPRKFVYTAFTKYDVVFTLAEAEGIRAAYFEQFPGLLPWHNRQKRLVHEYRRVQSPIGRIRHLPDIDSSNRAVQMEAERQAINSPVQSFASDMTMLSMIEIHRRFQDMGIDGHFISTVHDSLLFEIKTPEVARALPVIKDTMENLPMRKRFGVELDVPIVADIQVGKCWGETRELTTEEVYDYKS